MKYYPANEFTRPMLHTNGGDGNVSNIQIIMGVTLIWVFSFPHISLQGPVPFPITLHIIWISKMVYLVFLSANHKIRKFLCKECTIKIVKMETLAN